MSETQTQPTEEQAQPVDATAAQEEHKFTPVVKSRVKRRDADVLLVTAQTQKGKKVGSMYVTISLDGMDFGDVVKAFGEEVLVECLQSQLHTEARTLCRQYAPNGVTDENVDSVVNKLKSWASGVVQQRLSKNELRKQVIELACIVDRKPTDEERARYEELVALLVAEMNKSNKKTAKSAKSA